MSKRSDGAYRRAKGPGALGQAMQNVWWPGLAVMAVCYLLLTAGMVMATSPERFNLAVGDIAPKTITATKDVIDEVTTEARRERAAEAVLPTYREDEAAMLQVLTHLDDLFDDFETIRAYGEGLRGGSIPSAAGADVVIANGSFPEEDLDYALSLSGEMSLSNWQLQILMRTSASDLADLHANTRQAVRKQMESTIREGQIETSIAAIQRQVLPTTSSDLCLNIAIPAVRQALVPNMVIDQDATEAAREAARNEVEPTLYKSGQNIVIAGERVTTAELAMLEALGLLETGRFDMMMIAGVLLVGLLAMVSLLFHIVQFDYGQMTRLSSAVLLACVFLVTMVLSMAATRINPYFLPVAMVPLLCASLLSPSLAMIANTLALILVSILTNSANTSFAQQMLYIVVSGLLSAPVGVYIIGRLRQQRASVLVAGVAMAAVNFVGMVAIGLLTLGEIKTIINNAVWAAGGTMLAAVLCMGAQPILEGLFNLVTPFKLVELSNPNQPLLRRLLVETPGTYHHVIMVANLAEAAAEAIGADSLLTRVGAYYHDIGKLGRPLYFKENQLGDNPHDRTDPRVSAQILIKHVSDGVAMARQARLPEAVVDFIAQHHGDTLTSFFYQKMLSMPGGEDAHETDFMYPGPRPKTRETAIVMLADTVEAAIRAGGDQPADVIERRVTELIRGKIDSGQLNDSPLRFADVQRIARAFTQVLIGIYHKRIEYPPLQDGVAGQLPAGRR